MNFIVVVNDVVHLLLFKMVFLGKRYYVRKTAVTIFL